jgi:hypothetical protein
VRRECLIAFSGKVDALPKCRYNNRSPAVKALLVPRNVLD